MSEKIKIDTVAFEGLHRSGKGTQIEFLKEKLDEIGIPAIVVRGGGSRTNNGSDIGDPYSSWWEKHLSNLKKPDSKKSDWIEGSRRLSREMIVFRDRILPKFAEQKGASRAVLLIDRSILSHIAMLDDDDILNMDKEHVYGVRSNQGKKLPDTANVFPDLLFYLKSSSDTLLKRLDENDPKYEFRKKNILENGGKFDGAISLLSDTLKDRIITIDASLTPEDISDKIYNYYNNFKNE